jgi:phosphatidate cytidylyltransferase
MLRTRLWMGATLIALVLGVLVVDRHLAPWFPFLLTLVAVLSLAATLELLHLLNAAVRPPATLCVIGVLATVAANWLPHLPAWPFALTVWPLLVAVLASFVLAAFLWEMATFQEPGHSVTRMALAVWLLGYLGLLPSFLAQLRWLPPSIDHGTMALALTIFVPKMCDTGAYFTGRLLGRHKMTPVLSPKKTWEGAAGGLTLAAVTAVLADWLGPAPVLQENLLIEVAFGLTVGAAGMLGDLGESLVKRDCRHKDASQVVPGFGGVLDVVDALLFAAPVAYGWFAALGSG